LYWGYGIQVWNDDGDTVYVYDDSDAVVIEHTYPQGEIAVAEVNEAADNESVVLENIGGNDLDLTGWTVEDEAGYAYEFPDGFTLTSGGQVTLYTGDGTDTDAELYWEMGISVWNDDGDTVHVLNDEGSLVEEYTYPNGELVVAEVNEAAADENVVFKNVADVDTDLTGWSVEDEAGYSYEFPDGFTLAPGTEVTLYTGDGTDTDTELYWGMGTAVWNDDGDTVYAYDDTGTLKIEYTYPQGELAVAEMNEAASDENVVFENVGNSALDLTGWTVEDEAGYTYEFPDGFTVDTDSQVTLYTGEGTDTATELYWGYGIQVWNDDGDTVYVYDEADQLMVEFSY
jgi:FlaG/FlaF family flagellin (archaellin)